jgi:hypothetical protein
MLSPLAPAYQQVAVSSNDLAGLRIQLQSALQERTTPDDLADIASKIFFKIEGDGTSQAIYMKRLNSGDYSLRAVKLDTNGVFVGATTPTTRVPFFAYDPVTEQTLLHMSQAAPSAASRVAALRVAASQGSWVHYQIR